MENTEDFPFRIKYSEEFFKSFQYRRGQKDREGTALGPTRDGKCYIILWDGCKQMKRMGKRFVERITPSL